MANKKREYDGMLTTLYCDASWFRHFGVGGWAVWLRSEKGRIIKAGEAPDYCEHSYEAELAAIFAGIHLAVTNWPETKAVLVRSDCEAALGLMTGRHLPRHPGARRLAEKISSFKGIRLIPRWVKGHQRGRDGEAWLNRRVDQMARKQAEAARARAQESSSAPGPTPPKSGPTNGP